METKAEDSKQISISVIAEKEEVQYKDESTAIIMASLKAPLYVDEKQRAPIDLVAVVDTSGSMSGTKLSLVQTTLEFIIKEFNDKDRLSIISFDSNVKTLMPLTYMSQSGKSSASDAVKSLQATGSTALAGGLLAGLEAMRNRTKPNEVASVMLLTDGQANVGISSTTEIINAMLDPAKAKAAMKATGRSAPPMQQQQQTQSSAPQRRGSFLSRIFSKDSKEKKEEKKEEKEEKKEKKDDKKSDTKETALPCTVNTFGYGDSHDANMLRSIAEAADGVYYFIDSEEKVAESFADCLGGLLSVVAQNIVMTFEAKKGASIKKMLTKYKFTEVTPNKVYTVNIGDLQSEEKRDILCNLTLESLSEPKDENAVVTVKLEYFNVLTTSADSQSVDAFVGRPKEVTSKSLPPKAIDMQRNRIIASEAMEEANRLASSDKLEEGKKIINKAIETIKASSSADEEMVKGLLHDLNECLDSMTDRSAFMRGGQQKMNNMYVAHSKQRSTNYQSKDSPSAPSYETSAKTAMKKKFMS